MKPKVTIETIYDNINYARKETAGLPTRYYMLNTDMTHFLEDFVDSLDKPDQYDNIEDVRSAREMLVEAAESLNAVLGRLGEHNA